MNPFTLLKDDHKKVKALFKEYEALGDMSFRKKEKIAEQVFQMLEVHMFIEEDIFYPSIEMNTDLEGKDLVLKAYEEHKVVRDLIDQLQDMEIEDETYDAKFKVMSENVIHHIEEEESEVFPKAKKALSDAADEISEQMQSLQEELLEWNTRDLSPKKVGFYPILKSDMPGWS